MLNEIFNKLTQGSKMAINAAFENAQELKNPSVGVWHTLKQVCLQDNSFLPFCFSDWEQKKAKLISDAEQKINALPRVEGGSTGMDPKLLEVLKSGSQRAEQKGDQFIGMDSLIEELFFCDAVEGEIKDTLGINKEHIQKQIQAMRKGNKIESEGGDQQFNNLKRFAIHLTQNARDGKIDPVIGRDDEIRRILQILSRRTKNNPILLGEPGVGKTAVAEGIAQRIVREDVPENLLSKEIFALDMGALVAGAKFKGEFEERLKGVIKEVTEAAGEIILFIDEIHTLVGAGGGEGAMDAANLLKPALARGELRAIGATTLAEYQKYFEKDKALERRFQKVIIAEPDRDSSISILRGIKEKYETHHSVQILDEAIVAAVDLSTRYIANRFLPDKAIDLMDEAASKVRMEINSKPESLDEIDRKIRQLEVEKELMKKEKNKEKIEAVKKQLQELHESRVGINAQWEKEKTILDNVRETKMKLEHLHHEAEVAERDGDFGKVAEIRYGKVANLENFLEELKAQMANIGGHEKLIKEAIDAEEIAEVVSKWTGIPVQKMLSSESETLLELEDRLRERVKGQNQALTAVSDAIRRSRSGLTSHKQPIGSFLFMGTTGVGKTELAKALAENLFNDENAMTRIDMSEYQESHTVSRLVGAPPGYIGFDEGGQLTEAVRNKPYSLILLDEIEKAHPDVLNILLQVLDDGRLTDAKGRLVDFKNTIVIMTSNLGSEFLLPYFEDDKTPLELLKKDVVTAAKGHFRPEFLNRIDELVVFNPLTPEMTVEIIQLQLDILRKQLEGKDIQLEVCKAGMDWISDYPYEKQFGARPIKRLFQKEVLNALSKFILKHPNREAETPVVLDVFENEIVFREKLPEEMTF